MSTRWARVIRGLIAAGFAVFVAELAHVVGGDSAPGFAGVALALAFSSLVCIALAGRKLARWRVAASVILSQGAFHLLFLLFGSSPVNAAQPVGMHMGTPLAIAATTGSVQVTESGWMWVAHAVAAVITIVALSWGESAFWAACRITRLALARAFRSPALCPTANSGFVASFVSPRDRRTAHFLVTGLRHRGPPELFLAFR